MNKFWKLSMRAATAGLSAGAAIGASSAPSTATTATVSEGTARTVALSAVHAGTILSAELETEHGKLVWSFDIKSPKTAVVTEVQVDARTGRIVSRKLESINDQRREAQADNQAKR